MTIAELKKRSSPHFYAILIDKIFPRTLRAVLRRLALFFAIINLPFLLGIISLEYGFLSSLSVLFFCVYLTLLFLEFFYRSMRDEGMASRVDEKWTDSKLELDYALSGILFETGDVDVTSPALRSSLGVLTLVRAGVPRDKIITFLTAPTRKLVSTTAVQFTQESVTFYDHLAAIYEADESLREFVSTSGVNKEEFLGALKWTQASETKALRKLRHWSRENLGTISSLGTTLSFGNAEELGKFASRFDYSVDTSIIDLESGYHKKELDELETILNKHASANALIVVGDERAASDLVARLVKKIEIGSALPSIEHRLLYKLDYNAIIAGFKTKGAIEEEIITIFNQSVRAGNIMIYVSDIATFIKSADAVGVNVPSLLSPYFASTGIQIIASVNATEFHRNIEKNSELMNGFGRVVLEPTEVTACIPALIELAEKYEYSSGVTFTYASLLAIATGADRFITYGELPGKALDVLKEMAQVLPGQGIAVVMENHVADFLTKKTGIESGEIKADEAKKITNLETFLHKRVIGQNEAVSGIADAIRRTRSGITNPKRPFASFLFIGSTGVGKTELTKALAENFFGSEDKMIRFDMSEYNGTDALSRLIGDYSTSESGILANKIRENPYGVLLLDEFEKASRQVHDLFLQVLDEGEFSDVLGKKVGCRNLIIVATSNAGSAVIWDIVRSGKDLIKEKDTVINSIIKDGIYRPELMNRFDGTIFFHPLTKGDLREIARLGLNKLNKRLRGKEMELIIDDNILDYLVEKGGDPQFGGRSVNRSIQNEIEGYIAKKIIAGEYKSGSKINIRREDLVS